jgi:hypothetical protein
LVEHAEEEQKGETSTISSGGENKENEPMKSEVKSRSKMKKLP